MDSREKQKTLREHSVSTNLNAASDSLLDASGKREAELKITEAKQRLDKHRWEWICCTSRGARIHHAPNYYANDLFL